jgi:hypothetical protein
LKRFIIVDIIAMLIDIITGMDITLLVLRAVQLRVF